MKQTTKTIILILAFVLPICIFIFLKLFGRNEFDVPPLFATTPPSVVQGCDRNVALPYAVSDSIWSSFKAAPDSLFVIFFEPPDGEARNQMDRVNEQTGSDPIQLIELTNVGSKATAGFDIGEASDSAAFIQTTTKKNIDYTMLRRCVFLLDGDSNVVMVDRRGVLRGQYIASDREDIDRLLTEITILLKKY
jgi:hypothetical protein